MSKTVGLEELAAALRKSEACNDHPPLHQSRTPEEAQLWWDTVQHCPPHARREHLRWLGRNDLFFLAVYILNRKHFLADERKTRWTFARCQDVQTDPDNHIDLWPREHYKSEIITFAKTIQDILRDPELTFGFFSHTRPMAKDFLVVIKREFESNVLLKDLYDDILWDDPKLECRAASVSWSENDGITVKRRGNPKEATIEAWGLVDGQPTGKRYKRLIYDDVVSRDKISDDMIAKTTAEFDNSLLLTAADPPIFRYVATFQEIGDTTQQLLDRHVGGKRLRRPLDDEGKPACVSDEKFAWFKQNLSPKVFALQILLDPAQSKDPTEVGFSTDWMDWYDEEPSRSGMNIYVLVDPAGNSPDSNSRFAMWTLGLCADRRARVLDIVWDKYDLEERWQAVWTAVQKFDPLKVGYEKFAMQSDTQHFRFRMKQLNQDFTLVELGSHLHGRGKDARIGELIPMFRDKRFLFPRKLIKTLKDGTKVDLVRQFVERELSVWPYGKQKDLLDALARICDPALNVVWPRRYGLAREDGFGRTNYSGGSWMSG